MATILIVEDNPDSMKLFRAVLAARGHTVVGLPGGAGLEEAVRASDPAIVLLDIQLPGADGFQLLERLQANVAPLPPIVALTAHAMSGDRERAIEAGFDGYLTKPIDVASFGPTVEGLLRTPRTRGPG
jgi:CheY-like chemotaxis protein